MVPKLIDPSKEMPAYPASDMRPGVLGGRGARFAFWMTVVIAGSLTFTATAARKHDAVEAQIAELSEAQDLSDPHLITLATNVAFLLAGVVSMVVLILYLSLCAAIDSRVLPGLTRRLPLGARVGPGMAIGLLSTLPVSIASLALGSTSPKDSAVSILYIALVVSGMTFFFLRGHWNALSRARKSVIVGVLLVVAALSLVV